MSVMSFVSLTLSVLFLIQNPELSHSFVSIAPSNFATRNCLESNALQRRRQQRQQRQQQHKITAPLSSKNNKNILPGEDAFSNKSGSYVPFGLTAEEYATIKQKEATAQKQKNYGKWGPRFQEVDEAPEGNWITNSILWTKGFQYKDDNGLNVVTKERENKGTEVTAPTLRSTPVLAFFVSLFVIRVMRVLATLVRGTVMSPTVVTASQSISSSILMLFCRAWQWKILVADVLLAALISNPLDRLVMVRWKKKLSLSNRQIFFRLAGLSLGGGLCFCIAGIGGLKFWQRFMI